MRPSRRIVSLLILALLPGLPANAAACSCTNLPDFVTAYTFSAAVFAGQVLDVQPAPSEYGDVVLVNLQVETQWKGVPAATILMLTASNDGMCGFTFVPGERYLVYAQTGNPWGAPHPSALMTHLCWRTHQYWADDPDLDLLGPTPVATGSWGGVKIRYR